MLQIKRSHHKGGPITGSFEEKHSGVGKGLLEKPCMHLATFGWKFGKRNLVVGKKISIFFHEVLVGAGAVVTASLQLRRDTFH
jgi:hypothetical protein